MDISTAGLKLWVPPVIRGMTFDGETALVVSIVAEGTPELVLQAPAVDQDMKETVGAWRHTYRAFCSDRKRYPNSIGIAGESWLLGLGVDLDEAEQASGVAKDPTVAGSSRRADIMKRKISLVTGGAQGFGEGIVKGLIDEGGFVYIADMNIAGARSLAQALNDDAGRTVAKGLYVNVTDEDSVAQMMDEVASYTGSLDLFVSNAGVLKAGSVKEMGLKDFQFVTSVDYTGFFICTKFAARQMALQNMGSGGNYLTDIDDDRLARAASLYTVEEAARQGIRLVYLNTKELDDPVATIQDTGSARDPRKNASPSYFSRQSISMTSLGMTI